MSARAAQERTLALPAMRALSRPTQLCCYHAKAAPDIGGCADVPTTAYLQTSAASWIWSVVFDMGIRPLNTPGEIHHTGT